MFSIDQNSHSLWDTLPKLQALRAAGKTVRHYLEDIDVAFTALGAKGDEPNLHLAQERFHSDGGSDWGAALFYNDFLGRVPVEIRQWEPLLGMKLAAVARQLDTPLEKLYQQYAVSDNWMLIGSSYLDHEGNYHRIIGDLQIREVAPFVRAVIARAKENCLERFPAKISRRRTRDWFAAETRRAERLLETCAEGTLPDLYRLWMGEHLPPDTPMDLAGRRFAFGQSPDRDALVKLFLRDYDLAAGLYNQAVREADVGVHELDVKRGEAPFFAFGYRDGHRARCEVRIEPGKLRIAEQTFDAPEGKIPIKALQATGVAGLAGKAVVLALQVRLAPDGGPLALPHRGSLYLPACRRFAALLKEHNLLPSDPAPVVRVRFGLLDRMQSLDTPVHLPGHLAAAAGQECIPARTLGENWEGWVTEAKQRLADFADPAKRLARRNFLNPAQGKAIAELEVEKRSLARNNPKDPRVRELWRQMRKLQDDVLANTLRQISLDWQVSQLEFYDSRGALLPWCLALGGEAFYHEMIAGAEITHE